MIVLALDTALGACSVALGADGRIGAARRELRETGHAEAIMPMIAAVLAEAGVMARDLARIVVTIGPGSFTGTRIGLAAARGLALVRDVPVVGLSTFEALAEAAPRGAPLLVAFDARRDQVYAQAFDAARRPRGAPCALALEDLCALPLDRGEPIWTAGSAAHAAADVLAREGFRPQVCAGLDFPDAAMFLALGAGRPVPGERPRPLYLRPPDAVPASDR